MLITSVCLEKGRCIWISYVLGVRDETTSTSETLYSLLNAS